MHNRMCGIILKTEVNLVRYDIVTVVQNNPQSLSAYFAALEALDYDKSQIHLILVDCSTQAEMQDLCYEYAKKATFGKVTIKKVAAKCNAGKARNIGAKQGNAPFVLFLDGEAAVHADALVQLDAAIAAADNSVVQFDFRHSPAENGKHMDPVTLETAWATSAAQAVRRSAFAAVKGFDPHLVSAMQDFDLSWRLRCNGGTILYCPQVAVQYVQNDTQTSRGIAYLQENYNRLLLMYKYGNWAAIRQENACYWQTMQNPQHFDGVRKNLLKYYLKHGPNAAGILFARWTKKNVPMPDLQKEYYLTRGAAQVPCAEDGPLVSVVVRTHKRKEVLRRTLQCLQNQVYKNFEVVVVEDGADTAGDMVRGDFSNLNVRYYHTGENVGRGRAGNYGLARTKGELICFLDDDDFFYPDYIGVNVAQFTEHPQADLVISGSMAQLCNVESTDPYIFTYTDLQQVLFDHITLMDMCVRCRIPMPNGMFRRKMYEQCGGMHETIGGDEDWFMWLKFMTKGTRIHPNQADIEKATTICLYPADTAAAEKREAVYAVFDKEMLYDPCLVFTVQGSEIAQWEQVVQSDVEHLRNIGQLDAFVNNLKPLGEERLTYNPAGENTLTAKQINYYYYWLVRHYAEQK